MISRDPDRPGRAPRQGALNTRWLVLFLGTMFAPVKDRRCAGAGPFTHKRDDIVTIAAPQLGKLVNRMRTSDECEPWTFGIGALMRIWRNGS